MTNTEAQRLAEAAQDGAADARVEMGTGYTLPAATARARAAERLAAGHRDSAAYWEGYAGVIEAVAQQGDGS